MTRLRWALLLLGAPARAQDPGASEEEKDKLSLSSHLDDATSSFYVVVEPKVGSTRLDQQREWFGTTAAFGACVSCNLLYRYIQHCGSRVPIFGALLKRKAPEAEPAAECSPELSAQGVESDEGRLQAPSAHRARLGSLLLALLAVAAALGGGTARAHRGPSGRRRRAGSVKPRSCLKKDIRHSTELGVFNYEMGVDKEEARPQPKEAKPADAAARESVRRSLLSTPGGAMCRQRTDPCSESNEVRCADKPSRGKEPPMMRQQSNPGPKSCKLALEVDKLMYGTGGFVRQRAQQFESRTVFHRMASEQSVQMDTDEDEKTTAATTTFYRISTETCLTV